MGYLSDIWPQGAPDQLLLFQALTFFFFLLLERHKVALTGIYSSWEFYRSYLEVFKQNLCRTPFCHHAWCWCGWWETWAVTLWVSDDRELSAGSKGVLMFHNTGESLENSWDSAIYNSAPHKSGGEVRGLQRKQQKCSHSVTSFGSKRMSTVLCSL